MDVQTSFETRMESECGALDALFQQIISDMKGSFQVWDDFTNKATKLNTSLRATLVASSAFLEAFQKVADMAVGTRGATSEIGSALIRLCLRQRGIEEKFKAFANSIVESLVSPIQERMEDWKKSVTNLDKEHSKESKKCHQEIKKAHAETVRLKKKAKKGKPETMKQLECSIRDYNDRYMLLETLQRNALRSALIEERSRFCFFVHCIRPLMEHEVSTLCEVTHVQEILDSLQRLTADPNLLPTSSERVVSDPSLTSETSKELLMVSKASTIKSLTSVSSTSRSIGREPVGGPTESRKSSLSSSSSHGYQGPGTSPSHQQITSCFGGRGAADDEDLCEKNAVTSPAAVSMDQDSLSIWTEQTSKKSHSPTDSGAYEHLTGSLSLGRSSTSTPMNPYAVPNIGDNELGTAVIEAGSEHSMEAVKSQILTRDSKGDIVPLEGYVNMNQLACLACLDLKKDPGQHGQPINSKRSDTAGSPSAPTSPLLAHQLVANKFSGTKDSSPNKAITVEDVINSMAAIRGETTLKRGQSRDRSLPPLSRHSTARKNSLPGAILHAVGVVNPAKTPPCAVHGKQPHVTAASSTSVDEGGSFPPPPPQLTPQSSLAQDDVDDLPLPPPPDELSSSGGNQGARENSRATGRGMLPGRSKSVAPGAGHAGIIEHLTSRFYNRQTSVAAVESGGQKLVTRGSLQRCQSVEQSDSPASVTCCTHTAVPQSGLKSPSQNKSPNMDCQQHHSGSQDQQGNSRAIGQGQQSTPSPGSTEWDQGDGNSFTVAIQRGVRLRRTVTSDRSAPRVNTK